jgi:hypothetical protein
MEVYTFRDGVRSRKRSVGRDGSLVWIKREGREKTRNKKQNA